ncbi:MAG TPA: aminopeptidase, partial [Chitinophagaceae bacterium]|nr:aminopeptidase [Chitinophagaceae bacterium]
MKKFIVTGLLATTTFFVFGQSVDGIINAKEVDRIERTLSSDEMRGRRAFTPDADKAADFIADEFRKAGLQTMSGN